MPGIDQAHRIARERFGFERLRAGQVEAIEELLAGRDVLAVMPTGSGKSAVYQIAGVLTPGATLVVSPLIALQRDQVESIQETGVAEAAEVNASVSERERRGAWEDLADDELEFLFLAPEQLGKEEALERLRAAAPSLVVVDEAHCVSEWGHDFRPDYLRLGAVIEELGRPTVLALTATASPPVRDEILARLGMRAAAVVVAGFDRPNIHLAVERFASEEAKRKALVERVASARKPGIVYAATRRRAEELAEALLEVGLRAAPYHAGVAARERDRVQTAFMDDELDAIVATIAFGMGVDKPNVRFVFHHDVSDSVDSYYQEIGRAGRDGEPAEALLLFRPEDVGLRRFFAGKGQVDADEVERVASAVHRRARPVDPAELRAEVDLSQTKLMAAINRLEEVGAVSVLATGDVRAADAGADLGDAAEEAARAQERYREVERSRVDMIRGYAELRDCRREYLLNYFGERYEAPCGNCDNCEEGAVETDRDQPFELGSRVAHSKWGEGAVQRYERDKVVVLFDDAGYKTLDVGLVRERDLLEPA